MTRRWTIYAFVFIVPAIALSEAGALIYMVLK
jgi:hypothetical protein